MMSRLIFVALAIFSPVLAGSAAMPPCVSTLMAEPDFQACAQKITQLVLGAISGTNQQDLAGNTKKIFGAICSVEGREAFNCMLRKASSCPELFQQQGMSQMFSGMNITEIMQSGGLDAACAMMTGSCSKMMNCFQNMGNIDDPLKDKDPSADSKTPYSAFQIVAGALCEGPLHSMLSCVIEKLSDPACAPVVKMAEKNLNPMMEQYKKNQLQITTMEDTKRFTYDLCPAMPSGFASNRCIQNGLQKPAFETCYRNVTTHYDLSQKQDCKAYFDAKTCITKTLGGCGDSNVAFLAGGTSYVMPNVPKSCEKLKPVGAAGTLYPSVLSMLLALAVLMFGYQ